MTSLGFSSTTFGASLTSTTFSSFLAPRPRGVPRVAGSRAFLGAGDGFAVAFLSDSLILRTSSAMLSPGSERFDGLLAVEVFLIATGIGSETYFLSEQAV